MNYWKEIWIKRAADNEILRNGKEEDILLELKRSNGYDVFGGGILFEDWMNWYRRIKQNLFEGADAAGSVYEVGCGSGANLYYFERDGMISGGLDYSEGLVQSAKTILKSNDLTCDEAIHLSAETMYDAVFSNGVFSYFADEEYAAEVMDRMYRKARYGIGFLDILDKQREEDFIAYRKKNIEDYEERYKNCPKLFYTKQFFLDFASSHKADIKFTYSDLKGYWNNEYNFNCYVYKRREG